MLITHAHPDHYGGLTELVAGEDVPIFATAGVAHAIRRDDPEKESILRPMFGEEWPRQRTFPNRMVDDGDAVTLDDISFRVIDLGPGESPHDSIWVLEQGTPQAFMGDLVYNHMHAYLADGHHEAWLRNLDRLRTASAPSTVFYPGHGQPASPALLEWQPGYIRGFIDAVGSARGGEDLAQEVTGRMKAYLPSDDLLFLMQLSIDPVRKALVPAPNR